MAALSLAPGAGDANHGRHPPPANEFAEAWTSHRSKTFDLSAGRQSVRDVGRAIHFAPKRVHLFQGVGGKSLEPLCLVKLKIGLDVLGHLNELPSGSR